MYVNVIMPINNFVLRIVIAVSNYVQIKIIYLIRISFEQKLRVLAKAKHLKVSACKYNQSAKLNLFLPLYHHLNNVRALYLKNCSASIYSVGYRMQNKIRRINFTV